MNMVKFLQIWKDKIVCVFVLKDQLSGNKGVVDETNSTTDDEHLKPNIHVDFPLIYDYIETNSDHT